MKNFCAAHKYGVVTMKPINRNHETLTWLHLSDIHFGHGREARHRVDQQIVCDEILRDAGEMVEQLGPPDLVFVTGDIAFKADPKQEYPRAVEWIEKLLAKVKVGKDRLYLVPGNHDVDRVKAVAGFTLRSLYESLRGKPADLDELLARPNELRQLWSKLEAYAEFTQSYAISLLTPEQPFWCCEHDAALGKVILVGLNTVLLSFDNSDDPKNLALGQGQLQRAICAQPQDALLLVLQHHPPNWLTDGQKLRAMLQNRPHLLFCGHVHEQGGLISSPLHGGAYLELVAGAGHADPTFPAEHAYAWGRLSTAGLAYFPRTWNKKQHRFVPDRNSFAAMKPDGAVTLTQDQLPSALREWLAGNQVPKRGIAVLARRQGEMMPRFVSISVRFCDSKKPIGKISWDNNVLQNQAQQAVHWTGEEYVHKFGQDFLNLFYKNFWGQDKPYNCAIFYMPEGKYEHESLPAINVGMIVVYLATVLRDILLYDFELQVNFPESLFICAAGWVEGSATITGEDGLAEAIQQLMCPAMVLHARGQERNVAKLPSDIHLRPIDKFEDMLNLLLELFLRDIKSFVELHFSQVLQHDLEEWLKQEEILMSVEAAHSSRDIRLQKLESNIENSKQEREYLYLKIDGIRQKLNNSEPIPTPSQILDEFTQWRETNYKTKQEEEESGFSFKKTVQRGIGLAIGAVVGAVGIPVIAEAKICKQLYRRLATLCHPDKQPENVERTAWFPHLVKHRGDRLWLEAMEGAFEPIGSQFRQPRLNNEAVAALFKRLCSLHNTQSQLKQRIDDLKSQVESYGGDWRLQLGEEQKSKEDILRALEYDIDNAWGNLKALLGKEPY
jgi:predicted MPP superfamily phosphohydrolase